MQNVFNIYKQIATSNGLNEREQTLNELKDSYEDYLSHTLTASKFTIGLNVYDVSIQDVNDQNNKDLRDDKFMICSMSTPIVVGDIGIWDKYNEHYMVISDEKKTVESNKRFKIYPCNYLLKWVDIKGKSDRESYCVVEDATMYTDGIKEETIIKYQDQMIMIVIPSSVEVNKFKEDDRLFVDGKFYVVTSVNRLTKGITRLTAVSTLKSEYDNEELGIADYFRIDRNITPEPTPLTKNIIISGKTSLYTKQSGTYQATVVDDLGNTLSDIVVWNVTGNASLVSFVGNSVNVKAGDVAFEKFTVSASLDNGGILISKDFVVDVRRL